MSKEDLKSIFEKDYKPSGEENYGCQNGCYNCGICFNMFEYDEGCRYYCHEDKVKRPNCGSIAMEEDLWEDDMSEDKTDEENNALYKKAHIIFGQRCDEWDKWKHGREVRAWGICDNWVVKDES